jgi:YD repeat-containing protein
MKLSKLRFYVALAVVLTVGFSACNVTGPKKENQAITEYFRGLQFSETPYDYERGAHKLTSDETGSVNSYKFTYDNTGRLLSVEYLRGDSLLAYSSMGGAAKIVYDYVGNKQFKTFYNKKNERIESGGVYSAVYTLDDDGVRVGLKFFGKEGEPVENRNNINNYVWSIMPDGMVRELRYNLAGEETIMNPFCPFYELRFTYNDRGYLVRMANYMADTLYNCTAENCGDIGVSYFTFEPNEHGDIESFAVYNVTGQMSNLYWGWSKRVSKYDDNGYVTEVTYFDQDNEFVGGNSIPITQYKYDEHGAVVEIRNLDKNRELINHPESGIAITEHKYDKAGNRTETLRYDREMVPLNVGS